MTQTPTLDDCQAAARTIGGRVHRTPIFSSRTLGLLVGREVALKVAKPIVRCVATHVDPDSGERDIEVVRGLFDGFGHTHCGVYASVTTGGPIRRGDPVAVRETVAPAREDAPA